MTTTRFALVNVGSAIVWAAVHLLPAVALGRGLQVAHAANPRIAILIGLATGAAVLSWVLLRVLRGILIPAADRGVLRLRFGWNGESVAAQRWQVCCAMTTASWRRRP